MLPFLRLPFLKSFCRSTINQLAINSPKDAKSLSVNLDTKLLREVLSTKLKSLIQLKKGLVSDKDIFDK